MKLFIVDAFADQPFGGNPAGVALFAQGESLPDETWMKQLAAELKHSETAFVCPEVNDTFKIRYFTPADEVDLCGHATIASFKVLQSEGLISGSECTAHTKAGTITIYVDDNSVLMSMAPAVTIRSFDLENETDNEYLSSFYKAFGISTAERPEHLMPEIISTGLPDIILPVKDKEVLANLKPDFDFINQISVDLDVVGFHVFAASDEPDITAYCRNFAPRYAIDEEAATGTSNGALTYLLYKNGIIQPGDTNTFLQGEAMGRPSKIMSHIDKDENIFIGGSAVILFGGEMPI